MEILNVFLISMTPIGELRASIPFAIFGYKMTYFSAYLISVLGNIFVVFLILKLLNPISNFLSKRFKIFYLFFKFLFSKTRKNHSSKIKKYGIYSLFLFVAIPLPITGGWTASLVAFVFGIPFKKAFSVISLGILTSGLIVLLIIKMGIAIENYFNIQTLFGIILLIIFLTIIYKSKKNGELTFNIFK